MAKKPHVPHKIDEMRDEPASYQRLEDGFPKAPDILDTRTRTVMPELEMNEYVGTYLPTYPPTLAPQLAEVDANLVMWLVIRS